MKTTTLTQTGGNLSFQRAMAALVFGLLFTAVLSACQTKPETAKPAPSPDASNAASSQEGWLLLSNTVSAAEAAPIVAREGRSEGVDPAAMLTAHNRWRAQVGVAGLRWSDKLARVAQGWADQLKSEGCSMYHSSNGYGENIYKASALMWSDGRRDLQKKTPQQVTDSWGNEIKFYTYANNSCSGVCGHYTQVVWEETKEVGCAMSVCGDKSQIWVCSYAPAGNMIGQKPY